MLWQRLRALVGQNYLAVFLAGIPLAILANDIHPGTPIFKGQALAILAPLACAAIGFVLWLGYKPAFKYPALVSGFLVSLVVSWLVISVLDRLDGGGVAYTSYLVPLLVLMLLIKPISARDAMKAGAALAWATIAVVLVAETFALLTGYRGTEPSFLIRIPGLSDSISSGSRWVGPFESPNYAGPVAAYTAIFGWSQRGIQRLLIVGAGLVVLILSGSRSALFGLVVAGAVYFIFNNWTARSRRSRIRRTVGALSVTGVLGIAAVWADPTLNGRTPIWPQYWEFWLSSPWRGVGTAQIESLIAGQVLNPWFVHAHHEFLDLLGRYGTLAAFGVGSALALAAIGSAKAAVQDQPMSFALVGAFLAIGSVEVHGSWLYLTVPVAWLLVSVLVTANGRGRPTSAAEV